MLVRHTVLLSLTALALACAPTMSRDRAKLVGNLWDAEGSTRTDMPTPQGESPFPGASPEDFEAGPGQGSLHGAASTDASRKATPRER